ncbi:protein export cytoplasm protein SecA ATPase RNA helicase [alpha proteobacterium U9-1i]|nr:protein export cytoplasm protein SecA ATPase RNA helicase [alpha proteobacterium U9-1i]
MKLEYRTLANKWVSLEPLEERHKPDLDQAIGDPLDTLKFSPNPQLYHDGLGAMIDWQREQGEAGRWQPYAVVANGRAVGQTSFINPREYDRGVEIGGTWYAASFRGTPINPSCKLLLMTHAFDGGAERVELKTDSENSHSRAAILKLGAQFEGIHRHHMRRPWGGWRDTAWYSVLREEWPAVRAKLEARLAAFD